MARVRREAEPEVRTGTITRIAVRSGRPDRTVIYLDDRRALDVATAVVSEAALHTGKWLEEEDCAVILAADEPHRARERALRLLGVRDRTVAEIRSRLTGAGFTSPAVESTVAYLLDLRYLDDERFATRYVAEKGRNGWGDRRLRSELMRKGVDKRVIEAALAALEEDEEAGNQAGQALLDLVRRRFGRQWAIDREAAARRLAGFLLRRGYDWDEVSRLTRALDSEVAPSDPPGDRPAS